MASSESNSTNDTIMTLAEIASFLKVGERTVLKMVHDEEIPAIRIGNQWRFVSSMIDGWLHSKVVTAPRDELTRLIETGDPSVPLSRLIVPQYVVLNLEPGPPTAVLTQLTQPFRQAGVIGLDDHEKLVEALLYREEIRSTAIENGVAFPHLRTPSDNPIFGPLVHVGLCSSGTDFGSPDSKPTRMFFLICTNSIIVHLRVMAKLAQALEENDLVRRLLIADSAEAVLAAFLDIGK